ncbi:MAG: O-methyltransferase [Candidatus Dormibacteria bacterium]
MDTELWIAVDKYISDLLISPDPALDQALSDSLKAGLPAISVAPNQGKFLHLLARIQGANRILEVGTLGGYSTIWLARALPPQGRLTTLELEPKHADVARVNLQRAGLAEQVEIRVGPAAGSLAELVEEGAGPFDLVFIDADKSNNSVYFEWALRLTRPGSLIVVDNVVRSGAILDAHDPDPAVQGTRRLTELMAAEQRVTATEVQTVGSKGYDGFALALVVAR